MFTEKRNNQKYQQYLKIQMQIIDITSLWQIKKEFDLLFYILYQFLCCLVGILALLFLNFF